MSSRHALTRGKKQRALALFQNRRFAEAAKLYAEICQIDPRDAQAWCALSTIYGCLNDHVAAMRCAQQAIEIDPGYADAHNNLSSAYRAQGLHEHAEASARQALKSAPNHASALLNLGHAARTLNRLTEAVAAYEYARELNPRDAEIYVGLGLARTAQLRYDEAISHYQQALRLKPDFAAAYNALGAALGAIGNDNAAVAAYRNAVASAVGDDPTIEISHHNMLFTLSYALGAHAHTVFAEHVKWGQRYASVPPYRHERLSTELNRPLRVGYVSADLRQHSVGYFIEPILANHDHSAFEVFCYANMANPDAKTEQLQSMKVHWRSIYGKVDAEATELIRSDQIDILVDLSGHTMGNRLTVFACKPAPVQVTYLGYPNTTGLPQMDFRLTDTLSDPPGQEKFHTETLVSLPHGFLCYQPPSDAPPVEPPPVTHSGHITFGSFNALHKINQTGLDLWSAILQETPGSRLILKNKALRDAPTRERYLARLAEGGISADRVELLGWVASSADHLALYHRLDIALDTFPYCGTTTTCEALWMGVPVVTLAGTRHIERVGLSLLTRVGLPELAAADRNEYVRIATELARDVDRLAALRSELRERVRQSPLCDAEGFTHSLEATYRQMWRDWIAKTTTKC